MRDPYIYRVADGVTTSQLKKIPGMIRCTSYYLYRKKLYKNHIMLDLKFYIDDENDIFMLTSVEDVNTKSQYLAFYNPVHRYNNEVYKKVYYRYKDIMKELGKAGIVKKDYKIKWC